MGFGPICKTSSFFPRPQGSRLMPTRRYTGTPSGGRPSQTRVPLLLPVSSAGGSPRVGPSCENRKTLAPGFISPHLGMSARPHHQVRAQRHGAVGLVETAFGSRHARPGRCTSPVPTSPARWPWPLDCKDVAPRANTPRGTKSTRRTPRATSPKRGRSARSHRLGRRSRWSGRRDSNTRPPAPKAGALPGCATPRRAGV